MTPLINAIEIKAEMMEELKKEIRGFSLNPSTPRQNNSILSAENIHRLGSAP